MVHLAITKRIMIVMLSAVLMFSGLMLVNDVVVKKAQGAIPVFNGQVSFSPLTTGETVDFSVDIVDVIDCYFEYNISTTVNWITGNNTVQDPDGNIWTYTLNEMPSNAKYINFKFSANGPEWNSTGNINETVLDNDRPAMTAPLQDVEIRTGEEVEFKATGWSDNIDTILDNSYYHWTFISGKNWNLSGNPQTFTFNNSGIYNVTLSVKDTANNWNSDIMKVTVVADAISINPDVENNLTFKNVVLTEDGTPFNTTLYNKIFIKESVGTLSYETGDTSGNWTNVSWGDSYSTENLSVTIDNSGTPGNVTDDRLIIAPNPNRFSANKETVTVKATLNGFEILFNFSVTITSVNDAPVFVSYKLNNITDGLPDGENISFSQVNEDETVNITITADDADFPYGEVLSFGVFYQVNTATATIVKLDNTTANLTFTAKKNFVGTSLVIISVTDDKGNVTKQNLTFVLRQVNDAPSMISFVMKGKEGTLEDDGSISFSINEDEERNITIMGADPDLPYGEILTFAVVSKVNTSIATFGSVEDAMVNLTFKPGVDFNGKAMVNISLEDEDGDIVYQILTFTVKAENDAPSIIGSLIKGNCSVSTVVENVPVSLTVRYLNNTLINASTLEDLIDGDTFTYSWYFVAKPLNGTVIPNWNLTGNATGVNTSFTFDKAGTYIIWLKVSDHSLYEVKEIQTITVAPYVPPDTADDGEASSMPLIMIIVIVVILIGAIVVVLLMISKKKTETDDVDEFSDFDMPTEQAQPGFDQFGQPQQPQPGMDQFGQPQQPQPGMDQFGQPQQPQPGMDQFGQPQQPQPGMQQFGQAQQPQQPQPGFDQFGQPQQPQQAQPGFDQFGQPQQPQQAQPGMGQYGQPQQPQQPAMGQFGGAPMQQPQQSLPQAGAPMGGGNLCPHCHAPIEPGWFLCPNCKNQI